MTDWACRASSTDGAALVLRIPAETPLEAEALLRAAAHDRGLTASHVLVVPAASLPPAAVERLEVLDA